MKLEFTVIGKPVGWQRTGHNRYTGALYTQARTREHENLVKFAYREQCKNYRFKPGTYVEMHITAYFQIPQSASAANREKMISGEIRPTVKPDFDNISKLICDALNGVAYDDDKCIVVAEIRKLYSRYPRTVVSLNEVTYEDLLIMKKGAYDNGNK